MMSTRLPLMLPWTGTIALPTLLAQSAATVGIRGPIVKSAAICQTTDSCQLPAEDIRTLIAALLVVDLGTYMALILRTFWHDILLGYDILLSDFYSLTLSTDERSTLFSPSIYASLPLSKTPISSALTLGHSKGFATRYKKTIS